MKSPPQSEGLDPFSGRILEKEDSRLGWCRFFHIFFGILVEWQLAWWSSTCQSCQSVMLGEGLFWWVFWKVAPVARFRFVGRPHAVGSLRNLPAPRFGPRKHVLWAVGQLVDSMDLLWDWQNYRIAKPANHCGWHHVFDFFFGIHPRNLQRFWRKCARLRWVQLEDMVYFRILTFETPMKNWPLFFLW